MRYLTLALLPALSAWPQQWPVHGGDAGGMRYSALERINRSNVAQLAPAWEWKANEKARPEFNSTPGPFEGTPLMIEGVL